MPLYKIHLFDKLNVCILVRDFEGKDDLAALDEARNYSKTHIVEVWDGERRVLRLKKGDAELMPEDPQSL